MHGTDHSPRDPMVHDLHIRVGRLEDHSQKAREREHMRDLEMNKLGSDVSYIKDGQDKIFTGINRILWTVGLAVLGGITTFILSGGLVIVQP